MSPHTRDLVVEFVAEMGAVKFDAVQPLHRVERVMCLAEMVLAEVGDDTVEEMAVRSLASAAVDVCLSPEDPDTVRQFLSVRRMHLIVVAGGYDRR
jgi:hypothetical protein